MRKSVAKCFRPALPSSVTSTKKKKKESRGRTNRFLPRQVLERGGGKERQRHDGRSLFLPLRRQRREFVLIVPKKERGKEEENRGEEGEYGNINNTFPSPY